MDAKVGTKTKTKTFQNLNKNCPLYFQGTFPPTFIEAGSKKLVSLLFGFGFGSKYFLSMSVNFAFFSV